MRRRVVVALVLVSLLFSVAPVAQAGPPAIELPVSVKVTLAIPGTYVFRFELTGDDGTPRWSEQMDPFAKGRKITSKTLQHALGSLRGVATAPPNVPLDPQLFTEQLWLQVYRWKGAWLPCSARVRLSVVPYALWSSISDSAGEDAVTTFMIRDGAVTADKIQQGAVTLDKLGGSCPPDKPQLVYGPQGWTCGASPGCSPGDFLLCYDPAAVDRIFIGTCRPGVRLCLPGGNGFGQCVGAVPPAADACNGLDDDCDGVVDNPANGVRLYEDEDGDGRGKAGVSRTFCPGDHPGWAALAGDCNDADPAIFTGAPEICDSKDNDCNGQIDDGCRIAGACSPSEQEALRGCFEQCSGSGSPEEVAMCLQECVGGAAASPECSGATSDLAACYGSGCDPWFFDEWCAQGNCPYQYGQVFGRDPDCAYGQTRPCGDTPDGVGICRKGTEGCLNGYWSGQCVGAVLPGFEVCFNAVDEDCDGSTTDRDNIEVCDGQDNDCDGNPDNVVGGAVHCVVPPGPACTAEDRAAVDGCLVAGMSRDGFEQCANSIPSLTPGCVNALELSNFELTICIWERCFDGWQPEALFIPSCVTDSALCKDPYALLFAGRPGECFQGAKSQCGPATDLGICEYGTRTCESGLWGACTGAVYPQPERCEPGVDYDCDGVAGEGQFLYQDNDYDGFGAGPGQMRCPGPGWVPQNGDCDDANPDVNPGFEEIACDGLDNDCNPGTPDAPDLDQDGFSVCDGDCDDWDPFIRPGAPDICDWQDNDCDGVTDEDCVCGDGLCLEGEQYVCPQDCAVCGDGIIAFGEICDDGNTADGDGCSSVCTIEQGYQCYFQPSQCTTNCGDGMCAGAENAGNCPADCPAVCGDGFVSFGEECDDTNAAGGDGCSSVCTIEQGYVCQGQPSLCATACGDGFVTGGEQCDDGNIFNNDGCSYMCVVEQGYQCQYQPSICVAACGDGIVTSGEECDDGNVNNGDGCSFTCAIEQGYQCVGQPSACTAFGCGDGLCGIGETPVNCPVDCPDVCGDGNVTGGEQCDDGNLVDGDGCSAACTVE